MGAIREPIRNEHAMSRLNLISSFSIWVGLGSVVLLHPLVSRAQVRREWQPVEDYVTTMDLDPAACDKLHMPQGQRINPFLSYTCIATDFGFLGPSSGVMRWAPGSICVELDSKQWGGIWHSLNGKASDTDRVLDFDQTYPAHIRAEFQPQIVGLRLRGSGHGKVDVEFKSVDQMILWRDVWEMNHDDVREFVRPLPLLKGAKFLNWTSEEGCHMCLDQVALEVAMPNLPTDLRIFLKSYVKLARSYSERTGLVRDRAHADAGAFDAMPACGMFCLASALAAEHGLVNSAFARGVLRRTHDVVSQINTASGLLPHFVKLGAEGKYQIHPETEYSTVDSAIYFHSMLIASQILGDQETLSGLMGMIRRISFADLMDESGFVIHGIKDNGVPLTSVWRDWGGETALVLLLQHLAAGERFSPRMNEDGKIWLGTGFIPEIQSLFFPGFDTARPDRVSQQNWLEIRTESLRRQRDYFKEMRGPFAGIGIYGLSAGEGRRGVGYLVSGTELPNQTIIHPHYMLMSACKMGEASLAYAMLERMEDTGLFPPWGMVENVDTVTGEALPMLGSLNAGFEVLGAYHLMIKNRGQRNSVYEAVRTQPDLAAALRVFYAED